MHPEQQKFLSLVLVPARLNLEQAAWLLGFQAHDIPVLVANGLLKPLGTPPPNGVKYFAAGDLELLKADRKWLARATDALHRHWRDKNSRKSKPPQSPQAGEAA